MLKSLVHQFCLNHLQQQIAHAHEALLLAEEASKDDTKSSAGDKYETGREMAQQDINRNKQRLLDAQQKFAFLQSLSVKTTSDSIKNGSLVFTNRGNFYLSVGIGQFEMPEQTVYAISAVSPIGKALLGGKKGDKIIFNKLAYHILRIE